MLPTCLLCLTPRSPQVLMIYHQWCLNPWLPTLLLALQACSTLLQQKDQFHQNGNLQEWPPSQNQMLKNTVSGYRPISILPTVSKILEHHVSNIILDHICEAYPISDCQWGFMHFHSSTSGLISVIYDWLPALDNGHEICVVFFDVQKAFDSVPHLPLLQKLEQISINPNILRWVQSYLTEREQYVVVEGSCSPFWSPSRLCSWPSAVHYLP